MPHVYISTLTEVKTNNILVYNYLAGQEVLCSYGILKSIVTTVPIFSYLIQSIHSHPTSLRSILILFLHLCLCLSTGLIP